MTDDRIRRGCGVDVRLLGAGQREGRTHRLRTGVDDADIGRAGGPARHARNREVAFKLPVGGDNGGADLFGTEVEAGGALRMREIDSCRTARAKPVSTYRHR